MYGDGGHVRDWLHVSDHCRAIDLIIAQGAPGEVYDIGGGTQIENLALVRLLCEAIDSAFRRDPRLASDYPACPAARTPSFICPRNWASPNTMESSPLATRKAWRAAGPSAKV